MCENRLPGGIFAYYCQTDEIKGGGGENYIMRSFMLSLYVSLDSALGYLFRYLNKRGQMGGSCSTHGRF
jgi:hypothetical protein